MTNQRHAPYRAVWAGAAGEDAAFVVEGDEEET